MAVWLYPASKEFAEERAAELRLQGHDVEVRRTSRDHPTDVYEVVDAAPTSQVSEAESNSAQSRARYPVHNVLGFPTVWGDDDQETAMRNAQRASETGGTYRVFGPGGWLVAAYRDGVRDDT